jgi:hypothetical protein
MAQQRLLEASMEYMAGDRQKSQIAFLRANLPDLSTSKYQPDFTMYCKAHDEGWQTIAQQVLESGSIPHYDSYNRRLLQKALKVYDRKEAIETIPESDEATVPLPDLETMGSSMVSMAKDFKAYQGHYAEMTKSLSNERKAKKKLIQEMQAMEVQIDEVSDMRKENKRLRDAISHQPKMEEVCDFRVNELLTIENQELKQEVARLEEEKTRLNENHQRASEALSFQTMLLQEEQQRRKVCEENLQILQQA